MTAPTLTHTYGPRGAAREIRRVRAGEVLLSGPAGTGKSVGCMEKLHSLALLNPGMRGLITRKTMVSLTNTGLVTWQQKVVAEHMAYGHVRWFGGSKSEPAGYRYSNGSFIAVGGLDKPEKIMSSEYDTIYAQEATELTETDWESLTTRLRNGKISFQQLMADCNPSFAHHWLKARCDAGQTMLLESRHEDNPLLYDREGNLTEAGRDYIGKLDRLTGVRYLRLRKGLWVSAEGIVYEDWDPAVHLINKHHVPEDWPRYWVIDFGYNHPFTCQFWAERPDGELVMYREIYMTKRIVEDHCKKIKEVLTLTKGPRVGQWREPRPEAIICDHDAEDRATFERHMGLPTKAAHKSVSDGIQAFASRLKARRVFLMRDALVERDTARVDAKKPTCFAEEITGYVWAPGKEAPIKEDDDGCDAGRYIVAYKDLRKAPGTRGWI